MQLQGSEVSISWKSRKYGQGSAPRNSFVILVFLEDEILPHLSL